MAVMHLGHVAIRRLDLEEMLSFFAKLGIPEAFRMPGRDGTGVGIVYLRVDDTSFIELLPGGQPAPERPRSAAGFDHLCLLVDEIQQSYREAVAAGLTTTGEPRMGGDGNWQFWITGPEGLRVEMMQIMPDSRQAAASR